VAKKQSSRVLRISQTNRTETLAGRAAENSVYFGACILLNIGRGKSADVTMAQGRRRKIDPVARGQCVIEIISGDDIESRSVSASGEASSTAEEVHDAHVIPVGIRDRRRRIDLGTMRYDVRPT